MGDEHYFGGVEGGGTHSKMLIVSSTGEIIARSVGTCTNPFILDVKAKDGFVECAQEISRMVQEAKVAGNISNLKAIGLSLSGGAQADSKDRIMKALETVDPNIAEHVYICNDTQGSIFTASSHGGMVLIAGTGSNCVYIADNENTYSCGGWGHMVGDEGSAYWISHKAIQTALNDHQGLEKAPYPADELKRIFFAYFKKKEFDEVLDIFYTHFDKAYIAGFTREVSEAAESDALCVHLFYQAGLVLGKHVRALINRAFKETNETFDNVDIVLEGSVFKSWNKLKKGFMEGAKTKHLKAARLLRLTETSALGAAFLGARHAKLELTLNHDKLVEVLDELQW